MSQRVATIYDLLDAVSSAVLVVQKKRVLWGNAAAAALTAYPADELGGMRLDQVLVQATDPDVHELITADKQRISVSVSHKQTELDGGNTTVLTITPLPVPINNLSIYRQALENCVDGFFLLQVHYDAAGEVDDFIFVDMNAAAEALVMESREQMIGQRLCERFPIYRSSGFIDRYVEILQTGKVLDDDFEFVTPEGIHSWHHHQIIPLGGQIAVFSRSITERKQIENHLRDSENRYRALFDASNDCVTLSGLDGRYLQVNQKFADTLGYSVEEMAGKHILEFIPEHEAESSSTRRSALLAGEDLPLFVRVFKRKDGSEFLGEVDVTMVRDEEGTPLYIQSIIRDVTSRVETEKALRESEERYRIISELIFDYAYSVRIEPDGTMAHEWITDSFKRMTGFDYEEVDPATVGFALYHPDEEERINAARDRVMHGETVTDEYRIITKSGELRWMEIVRRPVWGEREQRVVRMYAVAQDITERKQAYEELRENEEKYRLIAENANDMISRTTADGIRTYVSSVCRTLLGYEPEEMIGRHSSELIHPEDIEGAQQAWALLRESLNASTFVCRMRHKSGEYKWFEVVSKAIHDPETSRIKEYVAVSRDISQRKQMDLILAEQERLRYELEKEQELNEVKSNLMRTISHEFRTPLSLILTSTDFLDSYIDRMDAERRKERLQSIRVQVKRLSEMLNDISFVVQGTLHSMSARKSMINMRSYCQSVLDDIKTTVGVRHEFTFEADPALEQGVADKALLVRIVSNLLSNAVKYSPENTLITLRLYPDDGDAVIQVADQGIGISADDQKRIFEPFYRSFQVIDEVGGTGLGLSIVKDCVDLHGGNIGVESEPDHGTTFTVRLPQNQENP